ncbi:hypothetical protein [Methanococcoides seepicolus]|uniref:Probable pectate lyase C n=1 Tax=Methanococcoides seepicolus TaxID=2828780 RepID=A0A9E4ZHZ5_9EURY|nr:hypothetical protein [Methanococcoides seepicolus]MCM1987802.1 hypothetical protein [Methanococcoides seepicolus]
MKLKIFKYGIMISMVLMLMLVSAGAASAETGTTITISSSDSLQDTIYAANDGDIIMMAPGYYNITPNSLSYQHLHINKTDLTLQADGGEVIIGPQGEFGSAGISATPRIVLGKDEYGTTHSANGLTLMGITVANICALNNQYTNTMNMHFEDCAFIGDPDPTYWVDSEVNVKFYLYDDAYVGNCTFSETEVRLDGNNVTFENNDVTGLYFGNGYNSGLLGIIVRNNSFTSLDSNFAGHEILFENNVLEASTELVWETDSENFNIRNNVFANTTGNLYLGGQLYENTFSSCDVVELNYPAGSCSFYLNNFIDTSPVLYSATYNTPTEVTYTYGGASYTGYLGNYYSSYAGSDANGDGVGEDAFSLDSYPLMGAWDAATDTIEYVHNPIVHIGPGDSLQDTIYAAENGDTIMMAPGTYLIPEVFIDSYLGNDTFLFINKSDLTFMADGGEVIIAPATSYVYGNIIPGRVDLNDTSGCDASGITFKGITFEPMGLKCDRSENDLKYFKPNQRISNIMFEGCTFVGSNSDDSDMIALYNDSSVLNCTFNGHRRLDVRGNNVRIENNVGSSLDIYRGYYRLTGATSDTYCQNVTITDNTITNAEDIACSGACLVENNVIDGVDDVKIYKSPSSIIRNNKFLNATGDIYFKGTAYQNEATIIDTNEYVRLWDESTCYLNDFTYVGGTGRVQICTNVTAYLNNFNGAYAYKLYEGINCSTPTPVTYTYAGSSHTGYLGNYYSEYTGNDTNADGVGDENITSSYGGVEEYPLMGAWDAATDTIEVTPYVLSFIPGDASVIEDQTTQIQIMASAFPEGLAGYNLSVVIDDPAVAEIVDVEYPEWASIVETSSMPGTSISLKALDGSSQVEAGAEGVVLATLTVSGKEFGSTGLTLSVDGLDDDSGTAIDATLSTGALEVTMTPLPGQTVSAQDIGGNGLYEDLNGDGQLGFVDVEVFFNNKEWIDANMPVECSDFNGNGRIDFDDIVDLFELVV